MTEEIQKVFNNAISFIKDEKYDNAIDELNSLLCSDDEEISSRANYLVGYIHTCPNYKNKKAYEAKKRLHNNITSNYPQPQAFVLYADIVNDENVAENYLKRGIQLFPDNTNLYNKFLRITSDKSKVIEQIKQKGITDISLLGRVISHLFKEQKWDDIKYFAVIMENKNNIDEFEKQYLKLINAYVLLFGREKNYKEAITIFKSIINEDLDNAFSYAPHIGIIYAYIQENDIPKATEYFDKIPVSNAINDFDDRPWPLDIYLNFDKVYKIIFECIFNMLSKDKTRKIKATALYALYLYNPSIIFDIYRYGKNEANILSRYLKNEFNIEVAVALYNMRCHLKQYEEAYEVLWMILNKYENPDAKAIFFSEILDEVTEEELMCISDSTLRHLDEDDYDEELFLSCIFSELIKKLHQCKQYSRVQLISEYFTLEQIADSNCAFECAYAYGNTKEKRSAKIYERIIAKNPNNSSAINNLGVQYEHEGDYFKALECYEKALLITPNDEIQQNNMERIYEIIGEEINEEISTISDAISLDSLKEIGYTTELRRKLLSIQDEEMKNVISRDLKECAIAVVSGQDKSATIMCGSIIEALLMLKIKQQNVVKYDISEISKSKHASKYPLVDMGLNELLFVAEKLKVIDKNSYHLGHYVRNYRNVVHPSKEVRMNEEVNHDNVLTMWAVLRRLVEEIL